MTLASKTGLLEGIRKFVKPSAKPSSEVEFPDIARPAPFMLRPFAGVYNPFPYGCSVLCNHPADFEAKDVVRKAKEAWVGEGKALLLPDELACLRAGLARCSYHDGKDAVPEELFRRYTDTDSRPLTPAPTLASGTTRGTCRLHHRHRRRATPDTAPGRLSPDSGRRLLVLDLRRSHSDETLAVLGAVAAPPPQPSPMPPARRPSPKRRPAPKKKPVVATSPAHTEDSFTTKDAGQKLQQQVLHNVKGLVPEASNVVTDAAVGCGDEEVTRRRGKRRKRGKKSGRGASHELEKEFQGLPEPGETQVSALDPESHNPSTRPSLAANNSGREEAGLAHKVSISSSSSEPRRPCHGQAASFLGRDALRHLQRELDQEVLDSEFRRMKHVFLEEALRCKPNRLKPVLSEEMKQLKKELCRVSNNSKLLLAVPRNFSRQSARFELPMDSRALTTMKPMEYIEKYILISSGSLLLYNRVFNRHKEELDDDESERIILSKNVVAALGEVMGRPLDADDARCLRHLLGWRDEDALSFRSWAGLCALSERLLGCSQDQCDEVERADFSRLPCRLQGLQMDPRLCTLLTKIHHM